MSRFVSGNFLRILYLFGAKTGTLLILSFCIFVKWNSPFISQCVLMFPRSKQVNWLQRIWLTLKTFTLWELRVRTGIICICLLRREKPAHPKVLSVNIQWWIVYIDLVSLVLTLKLRCAWNVFCGYVLLFIGDLRTFWPSWCQWNAFSVD